MGRPEKTIDLVKLSVVNEPHLRFSPVDGVISSGRSHFFDHYFLSGSTYLLIVLLLFW